MLAFSFFAELVVTNGLRVSKTYVTIDVRGADWGMKLYKPRDVDSSHKLPCMILAHGGLAACDDRRDLQRLHLLIRPGDQQGAETASIWEQGFYRLLLLWIPSPKILGRNQ
jgi:hypothetical protein